MQPQILRIDNIKASIFDNGLEYYTDRLLQDMSGAYYYVDVSDEYRPGWEKGQYKEYKAGAVKNLWYKIYEIPKELAWFCIDAIKLKAQVINIGNGVYGNGPHGGEIQYFIKDGDQFKEIPVKAVRVETL